MLKALHDTRCCLEAARELGIEKIHHIDASKFLSDSTFASSKETVEYAKNQFVRNGIFSPLPLTPTRMRRRRADGEIANIKNKDHATKQLLLDALITHAWARELATRTSYGVKMLIIILEYVAIIEDAYSAPGSVILHDLNVLQPTITWKHDQYRISQYQIVASLIRDYFAAHKHSIVAYPDELINALYLRPDLYASAASIMVTTTKGRVTTAKYKPEEKGFLDFRYEHKKSRDDSSITPYHVRLGFTDTDAIKMRKLTDLLASKKQI